MIFSMIIIVFFVLDAEDNFDFLPFVAYCTVTMFAISVVTHCAVMNILRGVIQFIVLTPSYVNLMLIYANCNIHDCTWGNRPDVLSKGEREKEAEFKAYRTKWLCVWILSNAVFAWFFNTLSTKGHGEFVLAVLMVGFAILVIRFIGSILYLFVECCAERRRVRDKHMDAVDESEKSEEAHHLIAEGQPEGAG
jgi:hypothetical protein